MSNLQIRKYFNEVEKIKKKFITLLMATVMTVGAVMSVNAKEWTRVFTSTIKGYTYNSAWEKKQDIRFVLDGMEYACMARWGFDTVGTNEDYVKNVGGVSSGMKAKGSVRNSKGKTASTSWARAYLSGKADVKHTGNYVEYDFTIATE